MSFRIRESDNEAEWIAEWLIPPKAIFIKSKAYEILFRELRRYLLGEVSGRSFLISGHRGSGKTTMVRLAVENLNTESLRNSVAPNNLSDLDSKMDRRIRSLQRPLLVKLHGPSLLGGRPNGEAKKSPVKAEAPDATPDQANKNGAKGNAKKEGTADANDTPSPEAKKPATDEEAREEDPTTFALAQITFGLYRALAAEYSRSFANHARDRMYDLPPSSTIDYLEFAGQFALDLDNAPRANRLRSYYERLKRIQSGILWPFIISSSTMRAGLDDQGIREIVALATAAQAFEVCSGDVTDKQSRKGSQSSEKSYESKVEVSLKDLVNKVLGLVAGIAVGLSSIELLGPAGAAAAGVATGLLSTLTLGWTNKRSVKDEQILDYTFIRKRDKEGLERDLPLVIQRVREAGLAPVFVLDELDKVKDPQTAIKKLISSLKHLTTDYGFFCFLTDRDYFDYVTQKVTKEAFPVEHSFFSHRMFILYPPQHLIDWLLQITQTEPETPAALAVQQQTATPDNEATAKAMFGLMVLHRSKLNLVEIARKIAEECDIDGKVRATTSKLSSDLGYLYEASIQLVILLLLRDADMRERVDNEPRFTQRAIDALYIMSRAWEDEVETVRLDRMAIINCLLKRFRTDELEQKAEAPQSATKEKPKAKATAHRQKFSRLQDENVSPPPTIEQLEDELLATGMSRRDLNLVERAVDLLGGLFSDNLALVAWLEQQLAQDPKDAHFRGIRPPGRLLELVNAERREYRFLVDIYGQNLETRAALQQTTTVPPPTVQPSSQPSAPAAPPVASAAAPETAPSKPVPPGLMPHLPDSIVSQIDAGVKVYESLTQVLRVADIRLRDLTQHQFVPPSINADALDLVCERLIDAQRKSAPYDELAKDLSQLQAFQEFVERSGPAIGLLLQLAICVARDIKSLGTSLDDGANALQADRILAAIARYLDPRLIASVSSPADLSAIRSIDGLSFGPRLKGPIGTWDRALRTLARGKPKSAPAENAWQRAAARVNSYVVSSFRPQPVHYSEIVSAALDFAPGRLLRGDLRQMTLAEWSEFCLFGFPARNLDEPEHPSWPFVAGLSILGFGRDIVEAAARLPLATDPDRFIDYVRASTSQSAPGIVLVMADEGPSIATGEGWRRRGDGNIPILAVSEQMLSDYTEAFDWLAARGAISKVIYEHEERGLQA